MSLEIFNLQKSYGLKKVVNDISFNVQPGEVVGLLGPNGAGKTTSFDMVVGLVKADNGKIVLFNKDITKTAIHYRSKYGIGYLTQEPSIFRRLTVEENLKLVLEGLNTKSSKEQDNLIDELLDEFHLSKLKKSIAARLSGGERRRVEIARVLCTSPKYILLDEPFTGIDPIAIQDIQKLISGLTIKRNIGILLTDHNPRATLSITNRAYIIQEGKIFLSGSASEIAKNPLALRYYLGEDFKL